MDFPPSPLSAAPEFTLWTLAPLHANGGTPPHSLLAGLLRTPEFDRSPYLLSSAIFPFTTRPSPARLPLFPGAAALFSHLPDPAAVQLPADHAPSYAYPTPEMESDDILDDIGEFVTLGSDCGARYSDDSGFNPEADFLHAAEPVSGTPTTDIYLGIEKLHESCADRPSVAPNRAKKRGKRRTAAQSAVSPTSTRKYHCTECGAKFLTSGVRSCFAHLFSRDPNILPNSTSHVIATPICPRTRNPTNARSRAAPAHSLDRII